MKHLNQLLIIVPWLFIAAAGRAGVLVNDVWNAGGRTYPAYNDPNSPYSEMGVDYDSSGDFESAWFNTGNAMTATPGHLVTTLPANGTSSASWTTYFTTEASPVTLSNAGDKLQITWVFTPSGVNAASGSSSGLRLAVVDSPAAARLASDGSPGSSTYAGYGIFLNMATTLGSSSAFQLMARSAPATSSAFLSSSGSWTALTNGAGKNVIGYADGETYTLVLTFTRNAAGGLDIAATLTGGSLNNTGSISAACTDAAPNSFTFDTFGLRPSSANDSAASFDTSLFKVETVTANTAASITEGPQDQSVFEGQNATFSVTAGGTEPLSYQWYYNDDTLLTNATGPSLTITNAQLPDVGGYSVVVSNAYGSDLSAAAQLTVSTPTAPSILTQPQSLTVLPGGSAVFSVAAGGSAPFSYQWYYNTNTALTNATSDTLTLTDLQPADAGFYSVVVTNLIGVTNSGFALLSVNTNPVAPAFSSQPVSQIVLTGGTAVFTAAAIGTGPIRYQWVKDGLAIAGATATTLTLTNVQAGDGGSYALTASNNVGGTASSAAVLTVTTSIPIVNSAYNLVGFGQFTTGGGMIPETDPAYAKVTTPLELANAVLGFNKTGSPKVIEIMNDLDLGWNEIGAAVQNLASTPFNPAATPQLHPILLQTGVSKLDIKYKNGGLTIFSANGASIRHCTFNIKATHNIIVRNLKFDEMWEWDEASKGQYDKNDWDFIDLANGGVVYNVWIDHCTFTKAYDGIVDFKAGSTNVTLSWCKYTGDDGATNPHSFVWQQINSLESNRTAHAFYNFLRNNGFSTTNIVQIIQGHDKTHLMGSNDKDPKNVNLSATFHHLWMKNCWDRAVPRLRAGNVHDFNIYVDDTDALAARRLRNTVQAAMSLASSNTLQNTYSFNPPLNGSISTEGGAVLVEKSVYVDCLYPLRNNQTAPSDPTYTGKILGLDLVYQLDRTVVRGNSTDAGSPLGPFQAPIIPFSWNPDSGAPGGELPYNYTPDDPAQLVAIVSSPTAGAGAGVLTWDKTNWLATTYAPTAPFMVTQPHSLTIAGNQSATFTVVAGGSVNLSYQWYFNTNTPVPNATNSSLTLLNVQATNSGFYSVTVTNSAGTATSINAMLNVATSPPAQPQVADWAYNHGRFSLTVNGDAGLDYIIQTSTNLTDWAGTFTNHAPTLPFTWTDATAGSFDWRFYRVQTGP